MSIPPSTGDRRRRVRPGSRKARGFYYAAKADELTNEPSDDDSGDIADDDSHLAEVDDKRALPAKLCETPENHSEANDISEEGGDSVEGEEISDDSGHPNSDDEECEIVDEGNLDYSETEDDADDASSPSEATLPGRAVQKLVSLRERLGRIIDTVEEKKSASLRDKEELTEAYDDLYDSVSDLIVRLQDKENTTQEPDTAAAHQIQQLTKMQSIYEETIRALRQQIEVQRTKIVELQAQNRSLEVERKASVDTGANAPETECRNKPGVTARSKHTGEPNLERHNSQSREHLRIGIDDKNKKINFLEAHLREKKRYLATVGEVIEYTQDETRQRDKSLLDQQDEVDRLARRVRELERSSSLAGVTCGNKRPRIA